MLERKEIRRQARYSLKRHYWIFVAACLLAAVLGTEYASTLQVFQIQKRIEERKPDITAPALGVSGISGEMSVFNDLINGDLGGAIEAVSQRADLYQGKDSYIGNVELGHSRGVLASLINQVASGTLLLNVLTVIDTFFSPDRGSVLLTVFGFILFLIFWLFLGNVYRVGYSRVFLESRLYEKIPFSRFVFLYRIRKYVKASFSMALYTLLSYLWMFTIVLYPVKRYAYLLAPYLAAENPDLSPMEVIRLSNRMMKGHKWEAFRLELSILPWMLLSVVTGGLAGILFFNPYREAVLAEYYAQVRRVSLENRIEGTEKLNDRYLFEIPPAAVLNDAYADIAKLSKAPRKKMSVRKGFWAFLEKYFGIVPAYDKIEKEYRAQMLVNQQIEEYGDALNGKTYPARLFPIPEIQRRKKTGDVGYTRHYSLTSVILLFFTGCMVGWTWEVGLHLLQAGEFVNRGVLHGPWLPIYGGGATLILLLLYRFRKNALLEFLLIIALCGVVEYFTSWILEVIHDGQRWWDYSGYYLNLNGRICAEGLLVFGIGGVAFVYVIAPLFDELIEQIKGAVLWPVCIFLLAAFAVDVVYSSFVPNTGKGISTASVSSESPSTRIV